MSKQIPTSQISTQIQKSNPVEVEFVKQDQPNKTTLNERSPPQKLDSKPVAPVSDQILLQKNGNNSTKENSKPPLVIKSPIVIDSTPVQAKEKALRIVGSPSRDQDLKKTSGVNSKQGMPTDNQSPAVPIDIDDIVRGHEKSNENLVHMIDNVEHLLQTYYNQQLNPSESSDQLLTGNLGNISRSGQQQRYPTDVINKIDFLIEKCRAKMGKMEQEHKRLYQVLINSEQKRREHDIKAQITINEADLNKLREHYNGLVRYNEGNINAVIKTSQTTKKLLNQMQNYQNEIKLYKHKHYEMMKLMRDEELLIKNQHMEMTDLISSQLKMSNEERMIRNNQHSMSKTGGNFNKSMTRIPDQVSSFTDLSPQSRYDKTFKMMGLIKKNRQFKREQFEHHQKNCYQQVMDNKKKIGELNHKKQEVDAENGQLREQVDQFYQLTGVIRNQLYQSPLPNEFPAIEYRQNEQTEYSRTLNMSSPNEQLPIKVAPSSTMNKMSKPVIPKVATTKNMKYEKDSASTKVTSSYASLTRNRYQQSASQLGPSNNLPPIITSPQLVVKQNSNNVMGRQSALQNSYSVKNMTKPIEFAQPDEIKLLPGEIRKSMNDVEEMRMQYE